MDINVIREFLDLSFTLNFSKTAERVFISQSALSKHIALLEKEVGIKLFERNKQYVKLTPAGLNLQEKFQKVIDAYDEALNSIQDNSHMLSGTLRIGYLDAAVRDIVSKSIQLYQKKYPAMKVSLSTYEVADLDQALMNNVIDISMSIAFPNSHVPRELFFKPLYNDTVSAVVASSNPLAQKKEVFFEDLLDYPLIFPSPVQFPAYANIIRKQLRTAQKPANIICDFSTIVTALVMVESEMGVSILPSNIESIANELQFIKITDMNPVMQVGIMWKKANTSLQIEEFVNIVCSVADELHFKS